MLFGSGVILGALSAVKEGIVTMVRSMQFGDVWVFGLVFVFWYWKFKMTKKPEETVAPDGTKSEAPMVSATALRHIVQTPEEEAQLKTMYCENCGWTMFVARNRMKKYFRDGLECAQCGAVAPVFKNINDPDDPINKEGATIDDLEELDVDVVSASSGGKGGSSGVNADAILLGGAAAAAPPAPPADASDDADKAASTDAMGAATPTTAGPEAASSDAMGAATTADGVPPYPDYETFDFDENNPPPMDKVPAEQNAEATEPALADAQWEAETWSDEAVNGTPEPDKEEPEEPPEPPPKKSKYSKDQPVPEHLQVFRELDLI